MIYFIQKVGVRMGNNEFTTETDAKYAQIQACKALIGVFLLFSLIACLGFLIAWQTFAFFEIIVIISCIYVLFIKTKRVHHWQLVFKNDKITITNLVTKESFWVDDISSSDLIVSQTKAEKVLDYCSLSIKGTVFQFGGIKNCNQLKAYIQENFN